MNEFQKDGFNMLLGEIEGKLRALELIFEDTEEKQIESDYFKGKAEGIDRGIYLLQELLEQAKNIKQTMKEQEH